MPEKVCSDFGYTISDCSGLGTKFRSDTSRYKGKLFIMSGATNKTRHNQLICKLFQISLLNLAIIA